MFCHDLHGVPATKQRDRMCFCCTAITMAACKTYRQGRPRHSVNALRPHNKLRPVHCFCGAPAARHLINFYPVTPCNMSSCSPWDVAGCESLQSDTRPFFTQGCCASFRSASDKALRPVRAAFRTPWRRHPGSVHQVFRVAAAMLLVSVVPKRG